jgi:hypothetical protein
VGVLEPESSLFLEPRNRSQIDPPFFRGSGLESWPSSFDFTGLVGLGICCAPPPPRSGLAIRPPPTMAAGPGGLRAVALLTEVPCLMLLLLSSPGSALS